jgi:protein-disulfide isomerase-like protein with CxxC motif
MCSRCCGFGKEQAVLTQRHPELGLQILVGGVLAGYAPAALTRPTQDFGHGPVP